MIQPLVIYPHITDAEAVVPRGFKGIQLVNGALGTRTPTVVPMLQFSLFSLKHLLK